MQAVVAMEMESDSDSDDLSSNDEDDSMADIAEEYVLAQALYYLMSERSASALY